MKQTLPTALVASTGVIGIVILDLYALSQGVDGTLFAGAVATIAAIIGGFCGFTIGKK